jgi:hypothetical protein
MRVLASRLVFFAVDVFLEMAFRAVDFFDFTPALVLFWPFDVAHFGAFEFLAILYPS